MELTECVTRDRATRNFTDEPVAEETVESVLDIARRAGSGKNRQPWSFVVVEDETRRNELADLGTYTTPLRDAPLGIVVLVDDEGSEDTLRHDIFDCGRAFQNMKLAATELGLGSVPQGLDSEQAAEILDVPDSKRVLITLAVGHPAEATDSIEGRDKEEVLESVARRPLDELVHWETY